MSMGVDNNIRRTMDYNKILFRKLQSDRKQKCSNNPECNPCKHNQVLHHTHTHTLNYIQVSSAESFPLLQVFLYKLTRDHSEFVIQTKHLYQLNNKYCHGE